MSSSPDQKHRGERTLPPDVVVGRRTPRFTPDSVPPALLSAHLTRAWAELIVVAGSVRFVEEDTGFVATASPGHPVVIVPERRHHIEPGTEAEFSVQFYDDPA